jgi:hypothetical protein
MESSIGMRVTVVLAALLLGGGMSAFLLGPVLFEHIPVSAISTSALVAGIGFGLFGIWLLLVSSVAPLDDLKKVLEPFQAGEAVALFLPYMLYVGTRSMCRALLRRKSHGL